MSTIISVRPLYIVLLLSFFVLGIFYPVIFAPTCMIDDERMISGLYSMEHVDWMGIFFPGPGYYYRPLSHLSFIVDKMLWGLLPSFMHLENIVIHLINALLVLLISDRILGETGRRNLVISLASAALFAVHPVNTEAVNWISGRTDLLAACFSLASYILVLKYIENGHMWTLAMSALAYSLGCLAKETTLFVYPFIIFAAVVQKQDGNSNNGKITTLYEKVRVSVAFTMVTLCYLLFRRAAFRNSDTVVTQVVDAVSAEHGSFLNSLRVAFKAFGFYIKKLFFPWPLNFAIVEASDVYVLLGILSLLACLYILFFVRKSTAIQLLGVAAGLCPAVLVALSNVAWTPLAERYLYLPSAFFALAIVPLVTEASHTHVPQKNVRLLSFVMVFTVLSISTVQRNFLWQDTRAFLEDTARKSKEYPPVMKELASISSGEKQLDTAAQLLTAISTSAGMKNKEIIAYSRAHVARLQGRLDEAEKLLKDNSNENCMVYPFVLRDRVRINNIRIEKTDKSAEKVKLYNDNIMLLKKLYAYTSDPLHLYHIGQNYLAMHRRAEALSYFQKAVKLAPDGIYYKKPASRLVRRLEAEENQKDRP